MGYIIKKLKNCPNHQPGTQQDVHWTLATPFHLMVHHLTHCNGYVMGIPKFQTNPSSLVTCPVNPNKDYMPLQPLQGGAPHFEVGF